MNSSALQQGTCLQGGKYKIVKVLGQGGFGITYLAEQPMLERKVCVKEFFFKDYCERDEETSNVTLSTKSKDLVERFRKKFLKEARVISKLHHDNIIQIYDIFEENGTAYYVMDYIEGESLGDMVKRRGAIPEAEAVGYIKEVACALSYIHRQSINHLDIKPGNIMLRREDQRILLIDFGVAKQYDSETAEGTTTTPVGISHGYSPAEQYQRNGVQSFSPQCDVYALAATLYKLLTGKTPPEAMIVQDEGLPVAELECKRISSSVSKAIEAAMLSRSKRTQSIDAFVASLEGDSDITIVNVVPDPQITPKPHQLVLVPKSSKLKPILMSIIAVIIVAVVLWLKRDNGDSIVEPILYVDSLLVNEIIDGSYITTDSADNQEVHLSNINNYVVPEDFVLVASGLLQYKGHYYEDYKMHEARLDSFYICKYELTQGEYKKTIGELKEFNYTWLKSWDDGSKYSQVEGDKIPVRGNYIDFIRYCNKRSQDEGYDGFYEISGDQITVKKNGNGYRLITPYEWVFAAYGGNLNKQDKFLGGDNLSDVAWHLGNSGQIPHPVGEKKPNSIGLYDMQGNAPELLQGDMKYKCYSSMDGSYRVSNWNYPQTYDPKYIWGTKDDSWMAEYSYGTRIILILPTMNNRNLDVQYDY